jgi:hypothetical protein
LLYLSQEFQASTISATHDRFMTSEQIAGQIADVASFDASREYKCPDCGKPCHFMGIDFKAPKRSDLKGWQAAQSFIATGRVFSRGVRQGS